MTIEEWWPALEADTRAWLVANNGDELTNDVAQAINGAGGAAIPGIPLSDDQVDWIEAGANGETA